MTEPRKAKLAAALKAALFVKLVFVAVAWALLDQGFYIGDAPTLAEGEPAASSDKPAAEAPEGKEGAKDEGAAKEGAGKTRQSFLSNLLELPPLNTESIQKDELGKYLEIAERKKRQLEERMDVLKAREGQLKKLESSIDDKLRLLDDERRFLAQTIQQEKDLKGERVDKLVTMYAKMEPKKAAPVFEKLDKDLVVELFKQLPQKQVTAILETMNPERSVFLSEYYGRVRSAREYDLLKEMNQSLRKEFDDCKGMPAQAAAAE
jgi:flagellar motility protein MotE (MotC chaperone)